MDLRCVMAPDRAKPDNVIPDRQGGNLMAFQRFSSFWFSPLRGPRARNVRRSLLDTRLTAGMTLPCCHSSFEHLFFSGSKTGIHTPCVKEADGGVYGPLLEFMPVLAGGQTRVLGRQPRLNAEIRMNPMRPSFVMVLAARSPSREPCPRAARSADPGAPSRVPYPGGWEGEWAGRAFKHRINPMHPSRQGVFGVQRLFSAIDWLRQFSKVRS